MMYDPIAARRADLERQIADAQRALDTIQMVPAEDVYMDGAIIRAEIRYRSGESTTYVFLKVVLRDGESVRWYHTGTIGHDATSQSGGRSRGAPYFISWRELQSWLIDRGRVIESWEIMDERSATACKLIHVSGIRPRSGRAHEDVQADILDVLRFEYGSLTDMEPKHLRVINKIMKIEGVYE